MLQSQIVCHTFLCFYQPRPLWNFLMETWDMPKELGLFYAVLLTFPLYIQWYQFIIFQATLSTPYHQVTSNFMLVFKILHMKVLNIVTLLNLKVVLEDHPIRLKTVSTIFKSKLSKSTLAATEIMLSQLSVNFQNKSHSDYSSAFWSCLYYQTKNNGNKSNHGSSPIKYPWIGITLPYFYPDQGNKNSQRSNHWCLKHFIWIHASDGFCFFQCWKHPWIYLKYCGYMFWYFIPLWVSILKKTSTCWHPKNYCHYIEESGWESWIRPSWWRLSTMKIF